MFLALPNRRAFLCFRKNSISLIAVFCIALVANAGIIVSPAQVRTTEGLRLELPANGNLRIENLRGGVIVEVWPEKFVSIAAITDSGQPSRSPAVIQRTDGLLSIRVARGPKRINLQLRIPARAHAALVTGDGSVAVKGLPAALLVQTISGEIRVDVPQDSGADVIADSKTGTVSSSFGSATVNRTATPQLKSRIGSGGASVRLYSQAGNIALGRFDQSARNVSTDSPAPSERRERLNPGQLPAPGQRPELIGQDKNPTPAGTPAPVSTGPEEISEGDVIRVDTELVSVNVSVVDRNTSRGISDLTKDNFHLYEDNVQQQIAHFDSASAPFNLILLIDLSGSTAKVVELIKGAALHFVEAARPFDRIGIITFAGGQVVVSSLTNDHQALRQRINSIQKPDGSTKLYDSLAFAMDEVSRQAKDSRRNAIVIMSDGMDSTLPNVTGEGSTLSFEEVSRQVKEFDGVVYSVWVKTQSYVPLSIHDIQQETWDQGHDDMKDLADDGGGAFYECLKLEDLAGAYERVVSDLGMVYTLSYRPTNRARDGSWRAIRVNVNRPNSVARGKRGYYAK